MDDGKLGAFVPDFVKELAKDEKAAADLPKLVIVKGYVGPGTKSADGTQRWRVYLNHAFTDYYEIESAADIVYCEAMDMDPEARQMVWLRHGVSLRRVRTRATEAEIPLLDGSVSQALLPDAATAPPRWVPGYVPGPGTPWAGAEGPPDGPDWEWSKCGRQCFSASP